MGRRDLVQIGREGEEWAARALRLVGYRILARRWRIVGGELDLVAEDEHGYAFIEVKTRRSKRFARPEDAVTERKLAFIHRAAEEWLAKEVGDKAVSWRVDVVAVELDARHIPWRITIIQYFEL